MRCVCGEKEFHPPEVEDLFDGELARVVRGAVFSAAGGRSLDRETLLAEVRSELALKMLSGKFASQDPRRASFKTYLAAAARNAALDLLRRGDRAASLGEIGEGGLADRREDDRIPPGEEILREELREIVAEALRALEDRDPEAASLLRARYFDDEPYEEIARRTGTGSVQALHVRAHRARRALRRFLRRRGVDGG